MTDLPTVITKAGPQPQAPAALLAQLIARVAAERPGYTANLPASLIEDISSTDVFAISMCDQARVELVNSLTPYGANAFLLNQLGTMLGVPIGSETRTSVLAVFTGTENFVIAQGFTITDGTYQYQAQDGGIVGSGGVTAPLFFLATVSGSWVVPAGTVNKLVTSIPAEIDLTVTNPTAGTPGAGAETEESYRSRVLQAEVAASTGMSTYMKTLLGKVPGVQPRLVSVIQVPNNGGWEIIVGGGDPTEVGYAIFQSLFDISTLVGSTLDVSAISNANPGVVTTFLNHNYATDQVAQINGAEGITGINGVNFTVTVIDEKRFSIGINTIFSGAYTGDGILTPNLRNVVATVRDYPNTYLVPFVNPPQQTVTMTVTWNTNDSGFISDSAVAQLGAPALADYVNSISAGEPMNLFELQATFQQAIASVLPTQSLTRMVFAVAINGIGTPPESGTGIIAGDPESYFQADAAAITIARG